MNSFYQLFLANLKIFYRNKQAFFWTIFMPGGIYAALSVLPIAKIAGQGENYSSYVLPGIIAMTIMQTGIYGLAYWMVDLKARGVTKRFMSTPLNNWYFILGIVTSRMVVVLGEVLVLSLLGIFVFKAQFMHNYISIAIISLLGSGIFLLLGLLISNFANSYESAAPITSAIGLPLTFLGNIFYPVDSLPKFLQYTAQLLPITYLSDGLRQAYLYPFSFQAISKDIFVLLIWLVLILLLTIKFFKLKE